MRSAPGVGLPAESEHLALILGNALDRLEARRSARAEAQRLLDAGLAHPDLPPGAAVEVTVVVPVKDRTAGLARLLAALRADPGTADCPVVVVDDGSADPAAVAAVAGRHGAGLVRHESARGPAAARNAGLRAVTTAAVAFVDSDCVPENGWLPRLTRHLADPRLAGIHFTGSTATFQRLWREVGTHIDRYNTYPRLVGETGGKDFVLATPRPTRRSSAPR